MALKPILTQRISQSLAMTPQLQQAIELLQMSNLEVREFLAEMAERNPLVDIEPEADPPPSPITKTASESRTEGLFRDGPVGMGRTSGSAPGADRDFSALDIAETPPSLRDHLGRQLRLKRLASDVAIIAHLLVDELDDDGYLRIPLFELADRAGVVVELVESALKAVQSCTPSGLGARHLAECLALQLREKNCCDAAMKLLLERLDLVADGKSQQLEDITGESPEALALRLSLIRSLDPKPGYGFVHAPIQTVVPDILVQRAPDGQWAIELNPDTLPSVLVDNRYAARIDTIDHKTKIFLSDCRRQVNWLTNALNQRATTILGVASEIIRRQNGFLESGVSQLQPMTLRSVATTLDIHESTVSRAISEKYLLCPRGVFALKFFFTTGLRRSDSSGKVSSSAVQDRIRRLILNENSETALSDTRIVTILSADGMIVARRTVAKYREAMGIPSSVTRQRRNARH